MKKSDDGRRIQRIEKEVQGIVSQFLMGSFTGDLPGIVTITYVRMTADFRAAKIFVSILNGEKKDHAVAAEMLQRRAVEIQRYLAQHLPMRFTPKLSFEADHSLEKVMVVDRILHSLAQEKKPAGDQD